MAVKRLWLAGVSLAFAASSNAAFTDPDAAAAAAELIKGFRTFEDKVDKKIVLQTLPEIEVVQSFLPVASVHVSTKTVNSLPASAELPAPPAMPAGQPKETGAGMDTLETQMEAEITGLVLGKSGLDAGATPMKDSIKTIGELINDKMIVKVLQAHAASQKELNTLMATIRGCAAGRKTAFGGVRRQKAKYLKSSRVHKTCRGGEAVMFTEEKSCEEELKDKKTIKQLKCKAFAIVAKRVGDESLFRQIVKKGGSESVDSYIKRITATVCGGSGKNHPGHPGGGKGGARGGGMLGEYTRKKIVCEKATKAYNVLKKTCAKQQRQFRSKKKQCDNIQDQMDNAACKRAVLVKDACESYAECYKSKIVAYETAKKTVQHEEKDRKGEWRALKRMQCLLNSFMDGKVSDHEVNACKAKAWSTNHLIIKYPSAPAFITCKRPDRFPSSPAYKKAEFSSLPAVAKGRMDANDCVGMTEIPTKPRKGSPKSCKCERVTLNGPYSPGPVVKCSNCLDVRRSKDKSSCPDGTKLFSPRSRADWKTFIVSAQPLRNPHWIVDVTRPQNGCGGCTSHPMNSKVKQQQSWVTSDGSAWWLRSTRYSEPNGDYHANCFLDLWHAPSNENKVTYNDGSCGYHSKSYYCQPQDISTKPKPGSPSSCKCEQVALNGRYRAKVLIMCTSCLDVRKTTQKNSCPKGTKLFSPASREDWQTVIDSAKPLRSPHWIIDVTRPSNGCGGCTRHAMNSKVMSQATWRTSDGSPWWLRKTRYSEPNGDYSANCYLDLWKTPPNSDSIMFNDGRCNYHSDSYYCQPINKARR